MSLIPPRRIAGLTALVLGAALITGCWGVKFVQMPQNALDSSTGVDSLEVKVNRLEWRIYRLSRQLEEQQEYSRRKSAQHRLDMDELKDGLNAALQLLNERGGGRTVSPGTVKMRRRIPPPDSSSVDSTLNLPVTGDSTASRDTASVVVPAAEEMYSQVYLGFARMDYRNALEDSRIFLEEYSGHPLEEKIFFIRGECFMQQEKYFDALKEYSKILKQYPDGEKAPGALLRTAIAYHEIGDRDLAAGVVRRLVRKYPESEEASTAKEKFGDMLGE
ncbi:MAG: tetratricopeptide repeat protein [Candidatus Latescibacteria bacterium]|nr:tetratricopeptide repeat protein [bacterium]MBD3423607.1 tetratricopeptide repeat protein [Candidatus Latescibacterota bacterium]